MAQSIKIHQQDYYHASAGEECISKLFVENVTDQDLEIFINRNQVPGTTRNYMCWSACHNPSDGMTSTMLVPANRTVDNFSGHILSMPADSTVVINYCFNLLNKPNQSVCVDVLYTSSSDYLGAETVSHGREIAYEVKLEAGDSPEGNIGFASFFVDGFATRDTPKGGVCQMRGWFFAGMRAAMGC